MDISAILKTVAPWIGTALGGPLGGMAVSAAADALGLSDKTTAALTTALTGATPEQMLALKQADIDFQTKMTAMNFDSLEKIQALDNADRDSARNREIQVKDRTPKILAYFVTAGFFGLLMILSFVDVPMSSRDILNIMAGVLGTAWINIIGYYYGSTRGSEVKSDLLAKAIPTVK